MPNYASKRPGRKADTRTPGVRVLERAVERVGAESGNTARPTGRKDRTDPRMQKLLSEFDRRLDELRRVTRQDARSYAKAAPPAARAPGKQENPKKVSTAGGRAIRAPLPSAPVHSRVPARDLPNVTRADKEAARQLQESGSSLSPRVPHAVQTAEARRAAGYVKAPESSRHAPGSPSYAASRTEPRGAEAHSSRASGVTARASSHRALGPVAAATTNRHELTLRNLEKARHETERQTSPRETVRASAGQRQPPGRAANYASNLRAGAHSERSSGAAAETVSRRAAAARTESLGRRGPAVRAEGHSGRAQARDYQPHASRADGPVGHASSSREVPERHQDERQELVRAMSTNETPHLSHATAIEKEKLQRESRLREVSENTRSTDRMLSERLVERERHTASASAPEIQSRALGKTTSPAVARTIKEPDVSLRRKGGEGGGRRELTGKLTITSSNGQRLGKADLQLDMG